MGFELVDGRAEEAVGVLLVANDVVDGRAVGDDAELLVGSDPSRVWIRNIGVAASEVGIGSVEIIRRS